LGGMSGQVPDFLGVVMPLLHGELTKQIIACFYEGITN
jgi:hypothetical protein